MDGCLCFTVNVSIIYCAPPSAIHCYNPVDLPLYLIYIKVLKKVTDIYIGIKKNSEIAIDLFFMLNLLFDH